MAEPLKNRYDQQFLDALAVALGQEYADFSTRDFTQACQAAQWDELELMQRVEFLVETLQPLLPQNFDQAVGVLEQVAPRFNGFEYMLFPAYVARFGLDHFDRSMQALAQMTEFSTSEFAVRPFIRRYGERMLGQMLDWTQSPNPHVRRLASEGSRPRLPWATALVRFKQDPEPLIPILEQLRADDSEYVRRSVANNLNDIGKDHPGLLKSLTRQWLGEQQHTDRLLRHACRNLLKAGDAEVMAWFGYAAPAHIQLLEFSHDQRVKIGDIMQLSLTLQSHDARPLGKLRIDYAISFLRPGRGHSRKVFRLAEGDYRDAKKQLNKRHSFRLITTRRYYAGEQQLEIMINGVGVAQTQFFLLEP